MDSKLRLLRNSAVLLFVVLIFGCSLLKTEPAPTAEPPPPPPPFAPQAPMKSGDYAGFFKENSEALKACKDPGKCSEALFNLAFLHCYSKSPYYDPRVGIKYIDDLVAALPQSHLAAEAMVWKDLLLKGVRKKTKKRTAKDESAKQTPEQQPPEPLEPSEEVVQEKDWSAERQRIEEELRSKNELIDKLTRQLEKSRQIDIEMEEKERGLLR